MVAGERSYHLDPHLLEEGLDEPEVARHIIFTQQVDGRVAWCIIPGSNQLI
jgi:hypothetical protein